MMEAQPKLRTVIIWSSAHDIDPHRGLRVNVMTNAPNPRENRPKPVFVCENPLIEILDNSDDRVLPQRRVELPKLDRRGRITWRGQRDNMGHAMCVGWQ